MSQPPGVRCLAVRPEGRSAPPHTTPGLRFATFRVLIAVMIRFPLAASPLVLPSLLLPVTPPPEGEKGSGPTEVITRGEFECRPHERRATDRRHSHLEGPGPEDDTEGEGDEF